MALQTLKFKKIYFHLWSSFIKDERLIKKYRVGQFKTVENGTILIRY